MRMLVTRRGPKGFTDQVIVDVDSGDAAAALAAKAGLAVIGIEPAPPVTVSKTKRAA